VLDVVLKICLLRYQQNVWLGVCDLAVPDGQSTGIFSRWSNTWREDQRKATQALRQRAKLKRWEIDAIEGENKVRGSPVDASSRRYAAQPCLYPHASSDSFCSGFPV
jgi:hypothetical protein